MKMIAFRADGGLNIGMGHIMRSLSLAKEFRKNGYKVYFISKYRGGIEKIKEENFDVIQLKLREIKNTTGFNYGNPKELDKEADEIISIIKLYNIDLLFIDTYNVTEEYFLKIKQHVKKLGYIDDLNKFVYPVDILINGNITAEYMDYKKYSEDEIMLLGPKYNLIRDEFRNLPKRKIKEKVEEIMITTGGSDPHNMSSRILNWLLNDKELKKLKINVIVGSGFNNKEELRKISQIYNNVILHENVKRISEIMLKSDIAISTGGSTLYELCACGTPTLAFIYADNQEFIVEKMDESGYVKNLGWYDKLQKEYLINNLKEYMYNFYEKENIYKIQKKLVDGKGVERIFKAFKNDINL
ncbi:UDP-2,4-diacetamido-2,4,6-trideoxy-beta-L-altropyranose hydrolase [Caminicella sporogenes]|uniref:UDP-2,4-diacetamido-2,4, 6-trideoxy-beta-L-altropyranose hydrolase n=1 Tax=Caminicella sporogenes TaxID=166485 RepID=UPI00253F8D04|nr:UDP-2,4-diacetamido-2,4,6-trideoxy-beta-L-altropyranose hydrolase [Caminicella sporogenes]WIF93901.1 UDP-2,4-diacetamido-2,4,6-trideoxy-beta-L-altropyranose hydrolase [Caminicella sporogenes]